MSRRLEAFALLVASQLTVGVVRAQEPSWSERLAGAVRSLETRLEDGSAGLPKWLDRFRLSGNTDLAFLRGERHSPAPDGRFKVENARVFLDSGIGEGLHLGELQLAGEMSLYVEWDAVREHAFGNRVGSLYLRLDSLFGLDRLNLKVGRVLVPFGEEYVRLSEQRPENPLISFSAAAPYGWDRGALVFGTDARTRLHYVAGVMVGDGDWRVGFHRETQANGKLAWEPTAWSYVSVSGLHTGQLGARDRVGAATLELGETQIRSFGAESDVPNFEHGVRIHDDPEHRMTMNAGEADVIFAASDWGRLWFNYGRVAIRSHGSSRYDRDLNYGTAEGILGLGRFFHALDKVYLAGRYSVIGTFDADQGYLLDASTGGDALGFNTKRVSVFSVGVGYRLTRYLTLKSEYSWFDFALVRGVTPALRAEARGRSYFGFGATIGF